MAKKLLVLLAGQSNMAGRGYAGADDLTPVPGVEYIRPDFQWSPAIEPITKDRAFIGTFGANGEKIVSDDPFETVLPDIGQKVVGVGPGRTFGKSFAEDMPGAEIGLIPTAVGGTGIVSWLPGGVDKWVDTMHPYDDAIKLAKEAQKSGKIVAILWHQGETDAMEQTPDYKEKLRQVVCNFRRDLDLDDTVPFIAGNMASFYDKNIADHIDIVDNAIRELSEELPAFYTVDTKDLNHRGDKLHFDAESLHILGARYYSVFKKIRS